jgi:acetyl-CoA carboxylase carboxyltransferase component
MNLQLTFMNCKCNAGAAAMPANTVHVCCVEGMLRVTLEDDDHEGRGA